MEGQRIPGSFGTRRRLRSCRRIVAAGVVVATALMAATLLSIRPLHEGEDANAQVTQRGRLLEQLWSLDTAIARWQIYIEPRFAWMTPTPAKLDPADLSIGSQLAKSAQDQASAVAATLGDLSMRGDAASVARTNAQFMNAISALGPMASGRPSAEIAAAVARERSAYSSMANLVANVSSRVGEMQIAMIEDTHQHLASGHRDALVTGIALAGVAIAASLVLGIRARGRERAVRDAAERHDFEVELQQACEYARDEPSVLAVFRQALDYAAPDVAVELLVSDSSEAHFRRAVHTSDDRAGCAVADPLRCPAVARAHTLEFPSSRALSACPYLKGRSEGDCAAVCVPVSIAGRALGVVHATSPEANPIPEATVRNLQLASRQVSERLAMVRAFERSEAQARSDPLTGLLNRRSLEERIADLQRSRVPFVVAYGDLDHFKALNDVHGHDAGDRALRTFARVLRDTVRPDDVLARYGGEEFVLALPNSDTDGAKAVLDRVRSELAREVASGRVPPFTVSFGVARCDPHVAFDEAVSAADEALLAAKRQGRDRVHVSETDRPQVGTGGDGAAADGAPVPRVESLALGPSPS